MARLHFPVFVQRGSPTFETLLRRIWAKPESADANLVRNFVRNLRRKLGDSASSPAYLLNERGVGYRMAKPPSR